MHGFRYLFALIFILAACTPQAAPSLSDAGQPAPAELAQPESGPSPISTDVFQVTAWVDNPSPKAGERINISGSLIKNGVYLGGMMMAAYWPDEDDDRLVDCTIQVIYQRGICIVYADDFPVGEYTPVRVSFEYFGQTFTGETGFTRQE